MGWSMARLSGAAGVGFRSGLQQPERERDGNADHELRAPTMVGIDPPEDGPAGGAARSIERAFSKRVVHAAAHPPVAPNLYSRGERGPALPASARDTAPMSTPAS